MKTDPIVVERTFDNSANLLWKALTDVNELQKWYFKLSEFDAKVGFKFDFLGGSDEKQYLHLCEITTVEECKKIAYSWRYDNYPGNSVVCWELNDKGHQTILRLTHQGVHTFEENGKDFQKSNFQEGWNYFVHKALKEYLENKDA